MHTNLREIDDISKYFCLMCIQNDLQIVQKSTEWIYNTYVNSLISIKIAISNEGHKEPCRQEMHIFARGFYYY